MGLASVIIEGVCTTVDEAGNINVAPMGPIVNEELTTFLFRPFQSSTTFRNLQATGRGVFHVTDDVGLITKAAIGKLEALPELFPAEVIDGHVIADACRWYEFEVVSIDDSNPRSEIQTQLKHSGRIRDFWGLNRARHVILETAILATRLHILDATEIQNQIEQFQTIVEKTSNSTDADTFAMLRSYIHDKLPSVSSKE